MAEHGVCADNDKASELGSHLDDRSGGDERAFKEVCRGGYLSLGVDDRREVVAAKTLCDVGALGVLADGNEYYRVDDTIYRMTVTDGVPYFEVLGQVQSETLVVK